MGAQLQGAQVTLTVAPQTLTALIRAQDPTFIDQPLAPWNIRAGSGNAGQIRVLKGAVDNATNRTAFLAAGESLSADIRSAGIHTDGIWLMSSTAGDTAWIFGVVT